MKDLRKFLSTTAREYLSEQITYKLEGDYINYYINDEKIGYIEYYYDGGTFSEYLPNANKHKEFYIAMIEVFDKFRGNDYSTKMINHIKKYAKEKGATIITLRVDDGMGFTKRQSNKGLERLYLKNGFKYQHNEDDYKLNKDLNLGAMYFLL
jgi:GNAT superfamily N-acetyltransferase